MFIDEFLEKLEKYCKIKSVKGLKVYKIRTTDGGKLQVYEHQYKGIKMIKYNDKFKEKYENIVKSFDFKKKK